MPTAPTSDRAVELARRFHAANGDVIAFAQGLTDDDWTLHCEREGRSVGQVVEHIAAGHLIIGGIVEAMALGLPLPVAARRTEVPAPATTPARPPFSPIAHGETVFGRCEGTAGSSGDSWPASRTNSSTGRLALPKDRSRRKTKSRAG